MSAIRAAVILAGLVLTLVASTAHALWLDIRATGSIDLFYDESGFFGFGEIGANDPNPLVGKRAAMRMLVNLDLAPTVDLSLAGHGLYYYDGFTYQPPWVDFSGSILGRRMREYSLPGGDPYHLGYATMVDGNPHLPGREIADYGLEGGLRNDCASDPLCTGAYETYASAAIQVGSSGLNFLDGVGLDQPFHWKRSDGGDPFGDAEFWFGKRFKTCDASGHCVVSQLRSEGRFTIQSLVVRLRSTPVPEPSIAWLLMLSLLSLVASRTLRRSTN